jgi:hypothetical protein
MRNAWSCGVARWRRSSRNDRGCCWCIAFVASFNCSRRYGGQSCGSGLSVGLIGLAADRSARFLNAAGDAAVEALLNADPSAVILEYDS